MQDASQDARQVAQKGGVWRQELNIDELCPGHVLQQRLLSEFLVMKAADTRSCTCRESNNGVS